MYTSLAKYYDFLMSDVDYNSWAKFIASFLGGRKKGMDLCCGTGKITIELKKMGYNISGVDLSQGMLTKARENAVNSGCKDILFLHQDIMQLELLERVDFFTIVCDGINYISNLDDVFGTLYNNLDNDGMLFFDISSEYKLRTIIGNNTFGYDSDDFSYIWYNKLSNNKVNMNLTFYNRDIDSKYSKHYEKQTQYIYSSDEIISSLSRTGFDQIKSYQDYSLTCESDNPQRIVFVAHKGKI